MVENEHNSIKSGTIYICYQGIGKTSLVNERVGFIDLESSNFRLENGYRPEEWYKYYVNIAFDIASQGYSVFLSSHDDVREETARIRNKYYPNVQVVVIYPLPKLKKQWIAKLQNRYLANPTRKNKAALENAKDRMAENVKEIKLDALEYNFKIIEIDSMDYNLFYMLPDSDHNAFG